MKKLFMGVFIVFLAVLMFLSLDGFKILQRADDIKSNTVLTICPNVRVIPTPIAMPVLIPKSEFLSHGEYNMQFLAQRSYNIKTYGQQKGHNIILALESVNDKVLQSFGTYSFLGNTGNICTAKGFLLAMSNSGKDLVVGGGCSEAATMMSLLMQDLGFMFREIHQNLYQMYFVNEDKGETSLLISPSNNFDFSVYNNKDKSILFSVKVSSDKENVTIIAYELTNK